MSFQKQTRFFIMRGIRGPTHLLIIRQINLSKPQISYDTHGGYSF